MISETPSLQPKNECHVTRSHSLHYESRRAVAGKLLRVVLDTHTPLNDVDLVQTERRNAHYDAYLTSHLYIIYGQPYEYEAVRQTTTM